MQHASQPMNRRAFVRATAGAALLGSWNTASADATGEALYNGIRLPSPWPPRNQAWSNEPMPVPYLKAPPEVIPIDVGRQLFVDDFLIEHTTLKRTFHQASYHAGNPVLKPDKPWEQTGSNPTAMVFSDGVWYDPQARLFKAWYMGGHVRSTCYATSKDGLAWVKPALDVEGGTNVVHAAGRDSATVWLDHEEKDPRRRFKLFVSQRSGQSWALALLVSPDGIHWTEIGKSGPCGDRTTVFYNPFRKVWVYSIRADAHKLGRVRSYVENADVLAGSKWAAGDPVPWCGADRLDPIRDDLKTPCQLYNLDCVAYESLLLGLFSIWRGQPKDRAKPNEVCLGFSRDGFHWHRPDRRAFLPVSERRGDWNWGNVQSAGGGCLVVGDKLFFYVSGRAGIPGTPASGASVTALATLRRDGFASLDAGDEPGTLTTRPVTFRGKHLFVNADCRDGELRAEVLDREGRVMAPFSADNCRPIHSDHTAQGVAWRRRADLGAFVGKPVKFRFTLKHGRLFAFWVSPLVSGASHGYVAAGGPGFPGPTDTVGNATK